MRTIFAVTLSRTLRKRFTNTNYGVKAQRLWRVPANRTLTHPGHTSTRTLGTHTGFHNESQLPAVKTMEHKDPLEPRAILSANAKYRKTVDRFLHFADTGDVHSAASTLHRALNDDRITGHLRASLYEKTTVTMFMKRRHDEVAKIAARMESEGVILPSRNLRAVLSLNKLALSKIRQGSFLSSIKSIFLNTSSGEAEEVLAQVLKCISCLDRPTNIAESTVRTFLETQATDYRLNAEVVYTLINFYLRAGISKAATRWLDYHSATVKGRSLEDGPPKIIDALPYTTYINGLVRPGSDPSSVYEPIMDRMREDGVQPDTYLMNSLIQAEVNNVRPTKAIRLYAKLRHGPNGMCLPDEKTYVLLFQAYKKLTPRQRDLHTLHISQNPLPSPRGLFLEMLDFQERIIKGEFPGCARTMTTKSLNSALQSYLAMGDFFAAQVVLAAFEREQVYIDKNTSQLVIDALTNQCRQRLSRRLIRGIEGSWVDLFLDLKWGERSTLRTRDWEETRRRVMDVGTRALEATLEAMQEAGKASASNPSRVRAKTERGGENRQIDFLLVLLSRAANATFGYMLDGDQSNGEWYAVNVAHARREALVEMLPSSRLRKEGLQINNVGLGIDQKAANVWAQEPQNSSG